MSEHLQKGVVYPHGEGSNALPEAALDSFTLFVMEICMRVEQAFYEQLANLHDQPHPPASGTD